MPARLVAGQGVLDVLADCRVDVSSGGLVIPEGCILSIHIFIVKGQLSGAERAAISDVLINAVAPEQTAILPVWDEGRVDGLGPVVQFFIHRQPEAQGVGTGQDDLHSHGGEHIGKEGSRVNKVFHQRDPVDEHISESCVKQLFEIPVHHRHVVSPAGFDVCGTAQVLLCHSANGLTEHGVFSSLEQAKEQTHAVMTSAVEVHLQLLKAVA